MLNFLGLTKVFVHQDTKKIITVLILMISFTILFTFCGDEEFGGMRNTHNLLKNIHTKINKGENKILKKVKHKLHIDETNTKNIFTKMFDRFYYISVCTTSLGFGDIYPHSFKTKFLTITYILLLFYICFFTFNKINLS